MLKTNKKDFEILKNIYFNLYGEQKDVDKYFNELVEIIDKAKKNRSNDLKELDKQREVDNTWYMSNKQVGIMLYVDLFKKDLKAVEKKIPYLKELGITYVHLMPILKMPKVNNDGGYAVSSYNEIDTRFGSMKDFEDLTKAFRKNGISVCLDFVINHTSNEHIWAKKAIQGEQKYMDMYYFFDDEGVVREYEKNMIEIFPKVAPGSFTYVDECKKYVMTTFYNYQWDLNYKNPYVFNMIAKEILFLANKGVEILRLDAIPYIWKKMGTLCRGLEEVHSIIKMFKIIVKNTTPALIFKGEAIVEPSEILLYFGGEDGNGCDTMYNAELMTLLWNSLATKNTTLLRRVIESNPKIPSDRTWINYVRCHDDIGWGFNEGLVREIGEDPFLHKQFLINFYNGNFDGSYAKGELYEFDEKTLDARTSGTLASLCGLEKAIDEKDEYQAELAVKRILMMHSVIFSFSGIPVIYSGDEIATLNDYSYKEVEGKSHDSRWLHRVKMEWDFDKLHDSQKVVYEKLKKLIFVRKENEVFTSNVVVNAFDTYNKHVLGLHKTVNNEKLVLLTNFTQNEQIVSKESLRNIYFGGEFTDLIQGKKVNLSENIILGPYEFLWLIKRG